MPTLIIKLNATGDVVRTTTLLHRFAASSLTGITKAPNTELINHPSVRCLEWSERDCALDTDYDLLINLEYDLPCAEFATAVKHLRGYGAYLDGHGSVAYTEDRATLARK